MNLRISEAARIMGGRLVGPAEPGAAAEPRVKGAIIDSRKARPGDLFFALKGDFHDGHDFVADALARGAAGAVVTRELLAEDDMEAALGPQVLTRDPQQGLAALAGWVRDSFDPMVVGITGSTGKTSVKDLLASITRRCMPTAASPKSYNNDLGVPLTLLAAEPVTEVVVCEMGARGPGHIARMCEYARPHIGIVTNVGVAHYEQFGSREAIAGAKGELIRALPQTGAAILNADDPLVAAMAVDCEGQVVTYGFDRRAEVRAEDVRLNALGQPSFRLIRAGQSAYVSLRLSGKHQVSNALAAAGAAFSMGLSVQDCRAGLDGAQAPRWRMEVRVSSGVVFVNDAYNANPTSVASALETCAEMAGGRRLVAVLGHMAELGEIELQEHRHAGVLAARLASRLVVVGEAARPIAEAARAAGMQEVELVQSAQEAVSAIGRLAGGDVVLVKASRVAALEKVTELSMSRATAP